MTEGFSYTAGLFSLFFLPGLGQKSTLAKIFTEKTSKSVKYRLPLRYKKKTR